MSAAGFEAAGGRESARRRAERRRVGPGSLAGAFLAGFGFAGPILLSSCAFFEAPERTFVSNRPLLEELARAAAYEVDSTRYRLVQAELLEDSLTFYYRGIVHPGDAAWVLRFSVKSSEQDPASIADIATVLPVVSEGREGFRVVEHGKRDVGGVEIQFARYEFQSPVRDASSKPLLAHGILLTFLARQGGDALAYHIRLDNQGDKDGVRWDDAIPFLVPIFGEEAAAASTTTPPTGS